MSAKIIGKLSNQFRSIVCPSINAVPAASTAFATAVYEDLIAPRAYRIDFIVEGCVVLELKALEQTGKVHGRQLLTYLKLTGLALGLLLNFGAPTMADGIERVVNNFPHGTAPLGRRSIDSTPGR